ncbi:DUF4279 domain-containing protein [Metasolibacillus sp.]|uniref:DUF4279 domain-containing protein n=1 Tax=Metasolibacillus sp. TaxID=2703680 RepID=UPI0025D3FC5C|nr:DUF4279 domain-containing protein [Metasolibacillus sp.]MCT6926187.1 DUF4279 domain-containing protein [Metasolibacillus sp.]MCT6942433.1 DUF4279 domain-containing protein [Metasolibacillus sp.]
MEQTSFYTYIKLAGNDDFPLNEVTARLQIEPTEAWRVGDKVRPNSPLERFYTCWLYKIGPVKSLDVDDVLVPLYERFHSKVDSINALKEQYDLSVRIVVVIEIENGEKPALTIAPTFSQFASSMGAEIDIDLYAYAYSEVSHD